MDQVVSITVAYNGAPFSGFARQPGQLTVQGEVERALSLLYRREVETTCAGRTDAGVHARAQEVSFCLDEGEWELREPKALLRSLNAITHEAIIVRSVQERPKGFSARFSALSRTYRYFLAAGQGSSLFLREFSWHRPEFATLDIAAMNEAGALLLGERDFKSFCKASSAEGKPTCRNLMVLSFARVDILDEPFVVMTVKASSFLHSMVRTLVGTLLEVGLGHREPTWVADVLAACDRAAASTTAPAHGLVLWDVEYPAV